MDELRKKAFRGKSAENKYVIRIWEAYERRWYSSIFCAGTYTEEKAFEIWLKETHNGTQNSDYGNGTVDYYAIFPANTRMLYS
jgi:hypothetical protein